MSEPATTAVEPTAEPRRIEREIEDLRAQLDELVDELDRRRHDAFDWRVQLRKHPRAAALGAGVLLAAVALAVRRSRRSVSFGEHAARFLRGVYAVGQEPERLERVDQGGRSLTAELAKTAALAGASVLVRRYTRRALGETD
jgi:hypothetical protein